MYIEVNTTHHITHQESLKAQVAAMVEHDIARFGDQVTHVEVHLDAESALKSGDEDIRCTIEARLTGRHAIAVTSHDANVAQAARGAASKLERALDSAIGKQTRKQRAGGAKLETTGHRPGAA